MGELERTLSFPVMLVIGINSIMGTGVFFLQAIAAGEAGPASILSWVVMAFIAVGLAMVFAELASMFDTAGGVYDYTKEVFGDFVSFMMGWLTTIIGNVTIAALVVGAIQYLNPALPVVYTVLLSILFILLFNFMAYRGMQTSSVMLVTFGVVTLSTVLLLLVPGLAQVDVRNLSPFFTHGFLPVFVAVFLVSDTFFGWQTVTFLAEETKDARRVIPKVLLYSTYVIGVLCVLFAIVALGVVEWEVLSGSLAPLALLSESLYGVGASSVFSILIYTSIIGSVAGWIVSSPRLLMALAKDKMFIPQLARVHETYNTPHVAILFQTVLTSVLVVVAAGSYEALLRLSIPLVFLMYGFVVVVLLVMRVRLPERTRYYSLPGGRFTAYMLLGVMTFFLVFWAFYDSTAFGTLALAGSLLLLGWPVYLLLKFTYDPDAVRSGAHLHGRLMVFLEDLLFPRAVRRHLLSLVEVAEKRVLEFGANAGTFTMHLAEAVGPRGQLVSTEFSSGNVDIIRRRLAAAGHSHVDVVHDEFHLSRVHPSVTEVDVFVSVGYLSYLQDLRKILRDVRRVVPEGGVVLFVEYVDYFWFLPNTGWTSDLQQLRRVFLEEGFSVTVSKRRGLLWNYLVVHGLRTDEDVPFV